MTDLPLFSPLLSTLRDAIIEVDEEGRISWANPAAELLLGGGMVLAGRRIQEFIPESEASAELLRDLKEAGDGAFGCDLDLASADGFPIPGELTFFREAGWPGYLVVILSRIEDSENAEQRFASQALQLSTRLTLLQQTVHELSAELIDKTVQLAEEKSKTEAVLASMGEGLLVIDPKGVVNQINDAACKILDTLPSEVLSIPLSEFPSGSKLSALAPVITQRLTAPPPGGDQIRRLEIQEKVIELSLAPILEMNGRPAEGGLVINLRDVTKQAEIERMKADLISIVSHEIRSPLANIIGYIDLVLNEQTPPLSEEFDGFLRVARKNSEKLMHLVGEMLDLSRLDAGKVEMNIDDVEVDHLISFIMLSFRTEVAAKNLSVTKNVKGSPHAAADMDRLQQVLTNLYSNAVKYTAEEGRIEIGAEQSGNEIIITVTDTGMGIKPEDQARLFQRFFRVRTSETRKISGTGLGLSIAKSLVDAQGGRLTVSSEYGKGSTFTVTLPTWKNP
jgi:signal transduction histidine kinase